MTALSPHAFGLAPPPGAEVIGLHIEAAHRHFGSSRLSEREAEIVRLILKGHSSKAIARMLGNSPETVKVHRKRVYTKLGLGSAGELFSLFMAAVCVTPPGSLLDPLQFLPSGFKPETRGSTAFEAPA